MSENKSLKLRFKLKDLEFEIEGDEKTVKEEFENFKVFVTNDLLPQINQPQNITQTTVNQNGSVALGLNQTIEVDSEVITDFPVMKQLVHSDLPKGEQEWVLIYAFYASNFGTESFTRKDIVDLYESSNRRTTNNMNSLSVTIKRVLNKEFIKFLNDTEYIMKPEGSKKAKIIIEGKSTSKAPKTKTKSSSSSDNSSTTVKKAQSAKKPQGFKLDRNLNLRPEDNPSIMDFTEQYKMEKTPERILVIVFYLKEILKIDIVNSDHIYTAYEKLGVRVPKSLYQLISDTKNKSGWLEFDSMENLDLTIQGRNAVKFDLSKS
jgi:hypothetical protein